MNSWDEVVRTLAGYGVASTLAVVVGLVAWRGSRRLLVMQRLRPGRWTGIAFVAHFLLLQACAVAAISLMVSVGFYERILPADANDWRKINVATPLAVAAFFAFSIHWLAYFSRTSAANVGLGFFRWREHVVIGSIVFFLATPVVLALFAAIRPFFEGKPHPVETMFEQGSQTYEWILLFAQTTIFAPLVEEWLFRGLLQGWLRRTNLLGHAMLLWTVVVIIAYGTFWGAKTGPEGTSANPAPFYFTALLATGYAAGVVLLYRPVLTRGLRVFARSDVDAPAGSPDLWTSNLFEAEGDESRVTPWSDFGPAWWRWKIANARLAIVGSAMVFAVMHTTWPQQIPMFVFGLIAGWLAFRTQSLVPGIVMHGLFNLVAFVVLWLTYHPGIIGNEQRSAEPPPGKEIVVPADPVPR